MGTADRSYRIQKQSAGILTKKRDIFANRDTFQENGRQIALTDSAKEMMSKEFPGKDLNFGLKT